MPLPASEAPEVTAVIPVHNGARYIRTTIESVLAQTYPHLRCVVVDDGSTDDTAKVVSRYGNRVHLHRQSCRGVSAARNEGVRQSSSPYLAFLDADDVWLPDKVEVQLAAMTSGTHYALAFSTYIVADGDLVPKRVVAATPARERIRGAMLLQQPGIGFSFTGMVTRAAFDAVGGFDEALSTSADVDFASRVSARFPAIGVNTPLAVYRVHSDAQMHKNLTRLGSDMRHALARPDSHGLTSDDVTLGLANLDVYLAARYASSGHLWLASRHAVHAACTRPTRLATAPLAALLRRHRMRRALAQARVDASTVVRRQQAPAAPPGAPTPGS